MKMTGIIPYTRLSMPPIEEYIDEIKDMWETHFLHMSFRLHFMAFGKTELHNGFSIAHKKYRYRGA